MEGILTQKDSRWVVEFEREIIKNNLKSKENIYLYLDENVYVNDFREGDKVEFKIKLGWHQTGMGDVAYNLNRI